VVARAIATGGALAGALFLVALAPLEGPLVIAHRGASGHRPEHTIEAYTLAVEMGADAIEPDLVVTRDGVLVVRHEHEIGATTDVATRFPDRRTTKRIDGRDVTGWFTEDLTLADVKTLRARERLASRSHAYDGQFLVPTFEEVVELAARLGRQSGRPIAVYPETKHPSYFAGIGLPLERRLVGVLERHGLTGRAAPVFIQSFEPASLRALRAMTAVRLVQLLDEGADAGPGRLAEIARYADGIGPNKRLVVPAGPDARTSAPTALVRNAHAAGLFVHVWTMRSDAPFLSPSYEGKPELEYRQFADLGVDGIFTDFPDAAVSALRAGRR
jgi:glycerophosphoryl diester phosphodiesterase